MHRRYRTWILASTLLLAVTGALWIATHIADRARPQPLLKRAVPVTDCVASHYDWLSSNQLLIERQKPGTRGVFGRMVARLDCRTHQYTPIAAIIVIWVA
jgi:hypothetical protein